MTHTDAPDQDDLDDGSPAGVDRPSKTQRKQQMHSLQTLGAALVELPDTRLAALNLPEQLRDAITEYRRTRSHEGRRRQMQYIGKLMRSADEAPLREAVAAAQLGRAEDSLLLHQAEHWRDALIEDDDALTRWLAEHPTEPDGTQRLRSLIRAARKEPQEAGARHGRNYRELFRLVKAQLAADGNTR